MLLCGRDGVAFARSVRSIPNGLARPSAFLGERTRPPAHPAMSKSWPLVPIAASAGLGSKPVVGNLWDLRPADALGWIQAYAAWRAVELCHPPRLPLWPTTGRLP